MTENKIKMSVAKSDWKLIEGEKGDEEGKGEEKVSNMAEVLGRGGKEEEGERGNGVTGGGGEFNFAKKAVV